MPPRKAKPKVKAPAVIRNVPRRSWVVFIADIHAGSMHGVLNPATKIDTIDAMNRPRPLTFTPSVWSETMWPLFGEEWPQRMADMAGNNPVAAIIMGDVTQGNRHPEGLYTAGVANQIEMARWALDPWLQLPTLDTVGIVAGTGVHSFGEGTSEQSLSGLVKAYRPALDVQAGYHYGHDISGALIDYSHHGPSVGRTEWTTTNAAKSYALSMLMADQRHGRQSPDIIARGHVHVPIGELVRYGQRRAWMVVCPANQAPNDYAREAARSPVDWTFGVVAVEILGGKVVGYPIELCKTIDIRTRRVTTYD